MPGPKSRDVDDYIAAFPPRVRRVLERVRATIRKTVPAAVETISYRAVAAAFADELADYEMSKGTIRFPLDEPVPVELIARIAAFRAAEVEKTPKKSRA